MYLVTFSLVFFTCPGESVFQITYTNLTGRSGLIKHEIAVNNSIEALHFRYA